MISLVMFVLDLILVVYANSKLGLVLIINYFGVAMPLFL